MTPRLSILLALLAMAFPLKGQDQLKSVELGTNGNVSAQETHAGALEKNDERSLERRINRFLCRVSEFFSRPVRLPNGYYLKESYGVVSLHDKEGKKIIDENAAHFCVKEPYVAVWGINSVYFLNTETGAITNCPVSDCKRLSQLKGQMGFKDPGLGDFLTFWDIKTGFKPVTWSQK